MRKEIYRKAGKLFEEGRVKVDYESEKAVYFTVQGNKDSYSVIIRKDGKHACTCAFASIHAGKDILCSHIYASLAMLMFAGRGVE
jgi:hypothetical protein